MINPLLRICFTNTETLPLASAFERSKVAALRSKIATLWNRRPRDRAAPAERIREPREYSGAPTTSGIGVPSSGAKSSRGWILTQQNGIAPVDRGYVQVPIRGSICLGDPWILPSVEALRVARRKLTPSGPRKPHADGTRRPPSTWLSRNSHVNTPIVIATAAPSAGRCS